MWLEILCFFLGDVNARFELRHVNTGDIVENESLNDVGDGMKGSRIGSM